MYHRNLGRVHWFLWHLDKSIKRDYKIYYNYALHRYLLIRYKIIKPYDLFVVCRTSKRCFRVMYSNVITADVRYASCSTSRECCEWIKSVYDASFPLISQKPP